MLPALAGCVEAGPDYARSSAAGPTADRAPVYFESVASDTARPWNEDAEIEAARQIARCTLGEFTRRLRAPPATQTALWLKAVFRDSTQAEILWVAAFGADGDTLFHGTIAQDPFVVHRLAYGDTVAVGAADVADWYAVDGDTLVAGFAMRVRRRRLPPAVRAREDAEQGYAVVDESPAERRLRDGCR